MGVGEGSAGVLVTCSSERSWAYTRSFITQIISITQVIPVSLYKFRVLNRGLEHDSFYFSMPINDLTIFVDPTPIE